MTTEISKNLTQYSGREGLMYQITVKKGSHGSDQLFGWVLLNKAELEKLVMDYIQFKLGGN